MILRQKHNFTLTPMPSRDPLMVPPLVSNQYTIFYVTHRLGADVTHDQRISLRAFPPLSRRPECASNVPSAHLGRSARRAAWLGSRTLLPEVASSNPPYGIISVVKFAA